MFVGWLLVAVALAYVAGLLTFKIKSRWCPECGATTSALKEQRQAATG